MKHFNQAQIISLVLLSLFVGTSAFAGDSLRVSALDDWESSGIGAEGTIGRGTESWRTMPSGTPSSGGAWAPAWVPAYPRYQASVYVGRVGTAPNSRPPYYDVFYSYAAGAYTYVNVSTGDYFYYYPRENRYVYPR